MSMWYAISVGAAGVGLATLVWRLLHPNRQLVVGERGILQHGLGWIPWDEIEGAYPPSVEEADTMRIRLRLTDRLARVLRSRKRLTENSPVEDSVEVRLDLTGSEVNAIELLQEILAHGPSPPAEF
jgi:hypothetical protein